MKDLIERQAAIDAVDKYKREHGYSYHDCACKIEKDIQGLPSAQPEYYDYSDIDAVWEYYAEEQDINLTDGAKQLKDAMWVGYQKGKQDAQPEVKVLRVPYAEKPIDMFDALSEEEKRQNKWYAEGFSDALKELSAQPEQQWIPCSERLPEDERRSYWVCTDNGYQHECRWTNVNPFWTNLTTDWHWNIFDIPQYSKVIAWMQLPEPYEVESDE